MQEFPSGASKHAVTTNGGDGAELAARRPGALLPCARPLPNRAAGGGPRHTFGPPKPLFKVVPGGVHQYCYAVIDLGQRFLLNQSANSPDAFTVVVHWTSRVR